MDVNCKNFDTFLTAKEKSIVDDIMGVIRSKNPKDLPEIEDLLKRCDQNVFHLFMYDKRLGGVFIYNLDCSICKNTYMHPFSSFINCDCGDFHVTENQVSGFDVCSHCFDSEEFKNHRGHTMKFDSLINIVTNIYLDILIGMKKKKDIDKKEY